MKKPAYRVLILVVLMTGFCTSKMIALGASPEKTEDCAGAMAGLFRLGRIAFLSIAFGVGVPLATQGVRAVDAARKGHTYIGSGIELDREKVESLLTDSERELLKNPQKNAVPIASMFARYLLGDYDHRWAGKAQLFPKTRLASSYFKGQSLHRGVCEDKSLVLHSLLEEYGIRSEIQSSQGETEGHTWVYLPDQGVIIDPTWEDFGGSPILPKYYFQSAHFTDGKHTLSNTVIDKAVRAVYSGLVR